MWLFGEILCSDVFAHSTWRLNKGNQLSLLLEEFNCFFIAVIIEGKGRLGDRKRDLLSFDLAPDTCWVLYISFLI